MDDTPVPPFPARDATSLIGATFDIFMRNLTAFAWTSIAPGLAISVLNLMLSDQDGNMRGILLVPLLFATLVIWSATVLVAAGAVLGHVPDVSTAYRCALRSPLITLLTSTLLLSVLVLVGGMLLIVPGLIVLAQTLLVPTIVVIERRSIWESLRRSRALGSGFYARNAVIAVIYVPILLATIIVVSGLEIENAAADVALALLSNVLETLTVIAAVLVYVDMRSRKERLDPATFALEISAAYGEKA